MPTRKQRARRLGIPVDQLPDGRGKNPLSHVNKARGSAHYRWNRTRIVSEHGYIKTRVSADHPLADPNGYTYEHLLVWVAAGRIRPGDGQVIHHRNEDKTDNRLSNLELLTRADHALHHIEDRGRSTLGRFEPAVAGRELDGRTHDEYPGGVA